VQIGPAARPLPRLQPRRKNEMRAHPSVKRHADGSMCLEGTRSVPMSFHPCCEAFGFRLSTCEYDIRFEWQKNVRQWVIKIAETAGGGGIRIRFCPHCGTRLKPGS
jgi:hypothetical protein